MRDHDHAGEPPDGILTHPGESITDLAADYLKVTGMYGHDRLETFLAGLGVFEGPGAHAPVVPVRDINNGRPASILVDHGSQSCADEKEARERGGAGLEKQAGDQARHGPRRASSDKRQAGEAPRRTAAPPSVIRARNTARITDGPFHAGGPFHSAGEQGGVARPVLRYGEECTHMPLDDETPRAFTRRITDVDKRLLMCRHKNSVMPDGGHAIRIHGRRAAEAIRKDSPKREADADG